MSQFFLIDIAGTIRLVFSLNDEIIIHHMMTLLNYLMNDWVNGVILKLDHSLARITK